MVTFNFVLTKGDCLSTHDCSQPWNIPPSKAVYITAGDQDKNRGNYSRITWRVFPSCTSPLPQLQKTSASEVCYRPNNKIESKGSAEFRSYCSTRAAKKDLLKKERLIGQHTGLLRYLCLQRFRFPAGPVASKKTKEEIISTTSRHKLCTFNCLPPMFWIIMVLATITYKRTNVLRRWKGK